MKIISPPPSITSAYVGTFMRSRGDMRSSGEIERFTGRARLLDSRLTERATCVLYVVGAFPDIPVPDLELAIVPDKRSVLYAVLVGLNKLGLVEVHQPGDCTKTVTLTDAGVALWEEALNG